MKERTGYGSKPATKISQEIGKLPVCAAKADILKTFDQHDTVIIQGETGSGKTTRT